MHLWKEEGASDYNLCLWLFSSVWHCLLLIKSPNMHFKSKDLHYRLKSAVSNIGFQKDLCF